MNSQGSIIRLIDVVLIILIGFASIADFTERTRMRMPEKWRQSVEETTETLKILRVEVLQASQYQVTAQLTDGTETPVASVFGADTLESIVSEYAGANSDFIVDIHPEDNTQLQWTVDVVDICEKYQLEKSMGF